MQRANPSKTTASPANSQPDTHRGGRSMPAVPVFAQDPEERQPQLQAERDRAKAFASPIQRFGPDAPVSYSGLRSGAIQRFMCLSQTQALSGQAPMPRFESAADEPVSDSNNVLQRFAPISAKLPQIHTQPVIQRMKSEELEQYTYYLVKTPGGVKSGKLLEINATGLTFYFISGDIEVIDNSENVIKKATVQPGDKDFREQLKPQGKDIKMEEIGSGQKTDVATINQDTGMPVITDKLIDAYIHDAANGNSYLQEAEGELIAQNMDVQVHVMAQVTGTLIQHVMMYGIGGRYGHILHVGGNHYEVIQPAGSYIPGHHYHDMAGNGYLRVATTRSDGNCMIDALHWVAHAEAVTEDQIGDYRMSLLTLPRNTVRILLEGIITTMREGGIPEGIGPDVTRALLVNEDLMNAHRQAIMDNYLSAVLKSVSERKAVSKSEPDVPVKKEEKGLNNKRTLTELGNVKDEKELHKKLKVAKEDKSGEKEMNLNKGDPVLFNTEGHKSNKGTLTGETEKHYQVKYKGKMMQELFPVPVNIRKEDVRLDKEAIRMEGHPVPRSTANDPDLIATLAHGEELSGISTKLTGMPDLFFAVLGSGGMLKPKAFNSMAKDRGLKEQNPKTKKEGKDKKTVVSHTNSYSMLMSQFLVGDSDVLNHLHPVRPENDVLDLDRVSNEMRENSVAEVFPKYVRQQVHISKNEESRKKQFEERGLLKEGTGLLPVKNGRELFHTEAQWFHSASLKKLVERTVYWIKQMIGGKPGKFEADLESDDQSMLMNLLSMGQHKIITIINRSSCTSKSGYDGGCTQEGADAIRAFWAYCTSQLGERLTNLIQDLGLISFEFSIAARDTNAAENTFKTFAEEGISVMIHQKFDFEKNMAQPFDTNQFEAMKMIRKFRDDKKIRTVTLSKAGKGPDFKGLKRFEVLRNSLMVLLDGRIADLLSGDLTSGHFSRYLDSLSKLFYDTGSQLLFAAIAEGHPGTKEFIVSHTEILAGLNASLQYDTGEAVYVPPIFIKDYKGNLQVVAMKMRQTFMEFWDSYFI